MPPQVAVLDALVRRMSVLPGSRSIVLASAGFRVQPDQQVAMDQLIDRAVQSRITITAVHFSGFYRNDVRTAMENHHLGTQEAQASDPLGGSIDPGNLFALAKGTGGEILEATNSALQVFRELQTAPCVYVLGFQPESEADGRFHKLKIKLKDSRKLNVRAREGYYATQAATPEASRIESGSSAILGNRSAETAPALRTSESPERSTIREAVTFSSHSTLVLVPVIVRDRNGHAVGNLQKTNFQLWDGHKHEEIRNFSEESAEPESLPAAARREETASTTKSSPGNASVAVVPDNFLAYVFDDVHIRFADLKQVREAVWRNIVDTLQPATRIAVVTTSAKVMLDFTDDREKIHDALYRIQPTPVFRTVCGLHVPPVACAEKLSYLHAYKILTSDREALWKAVPLVTGAAISSAIGRNLPSDSPLEMRAEAAANAPVAAGERETELSLNTLRDLARRMASLGGRRNIVLLSHGFFVTDNLQNELAETIDWAIRCGVVINTLNSSGLRSGFEEESPWDDDTVGPFGGSPYTHDAQMAGAASLETVAEGTGGAWIENSNDYLAGVRRLAGPPDHRYVLGFPADLVANGSFHRLTIKLVNSDLKEYSIQARRGYYAPKRGEGLTEAGAKEIETAIFTRDELRDLPVDLRVESQRVEGRGGTLTLFVDVDLKLLHYRQIDGRYRDDVTVVAGVFDHNGNFVAGKQLLLKLRLRDQTLANLDEQRPETLKATFDLSPGSYLVRLVARSSEGQAMAAASRTVQIP